MRNFSRVESSFTCFFPNPSLVLHEFANFLAQWSKILNGVQNWFGDVVEVAFRRGRQALAIKGDLHKACEIAEQVHFRESRTLLRFQS